MSTPLHDRLVGGLLGLVVGDALGVPVEFTGRQVRDRDPVTGMRGFGTWNQPPGTWSDDSSLALASAAALAEHGWDLGAMMAGFLRWYDAAEWTAHGRVFDIGKATRTAIVSYRIHGDWSDCGVTGEHENGNGSLMRILPGSCWLFGREADEQIRLAGEAGALTHAHLRARLACGWHALMVDALLAGRDARAAARTAADRLRPHVPAAERTSFARLLDGRALDLPRAEVPSDGYVISTAEAALWCLARNDDYAGAVLAAVNLGGDTDTTAAVVGGLAGLRGGRAAIPAEWLAAIARRDDVGALAGRWAERCLVAWDS